LPWAELGPCLLELEQLAHSGQRAQLRSFLLGLAFAGNHAAEPVTLPDGEVLAFESNEPVSIDLDAAEEKYRRGLFPVTQDPLRSGGLQTALAELD